MKRFFRKRTYLDYAALTPVDRRVEKEMEKYSSTAYTNPSSLYKEGVEAKKILEASRAKVAGFIHAHADEIFFTSGGTESNNLATIGVVESLREKGVEYHEMHILISAIEHSSIIECADYLNEKGVLLDKIVVGQDGRISLDDLAHKIKPNTVIVSIMTVNNEIGTIQPINEAAKIIRKARKVNQEKSPFNFQSRTLYPLFHTDAAQGTLYRELDVEKLGVDMLTLDGSKMYGPRGVGCLYIKRGTPIVPIVHGGGQEGNIRSGTENIPAIAGFAKAIEIAVNERVDESKRILEMKRMMIRSLVEVVPDIVFNPPLELEEDFVSPHILNISIPGIDNEFFVLKLDARGIACSTRSSCLRDSDESYVLKEIGADSRTSLRFSFGSGIDKSDIRRVALAIKDIMKK